jgi:hypothetical protein
MKPSPIACDCCGRDERRADVQPVNVERPDGSERTTLPLCAECRGKRTATWRLRWQPADTEQAAA